MPKVRQFDSSKTRVGPVFDALRSQGGDWVRPLLALPRHGHARCSVAAGDADLTFIEGRWEPSEKRLEPPVALLSWLIRHFDGEVGSAATPTDRKRAALARRDPAVISEALALLRRDPAPKGWQVLEGATCPDAFIVTPDALIVVEGKRTEPGPTVSTTWMSGRHQMLRHIDAAWEIRGARRVYGLFIVESPDEGIPSAWIDAAAQTVGEAALSSSLPHRSEDEKHGIAEAFLGVTTWATVCDEFGLDRGILIERLPV